MTPARFTPRARRAVASGLLLPLAFSLVLSTPLPFRAAFAAEPPPPPLAPRAFDVDAPIAILAEPVSGRILFRKNIDQPHPPASITKIMTMLLVMEAIDRGDIHFTDMVTVSGRASQTGGSQAYLAQGEQFSVEDLLKAVAIHSANDACVALAEFIAGDSEAFVDSMNEKAHQLGMTRTAFHTPHGLPPEPGQEADMTTARDVYTMSREIIRKHPAVLKFTGTAHDTFRDGKFRLDNTNKLVGTVAGVDGLKTGFFAAAGFGLAATATRRNLRLISVVMGARSNNQRASDSARLLNYGFSRLRNQLAVKKGLPVGDLPVAKGREEKVAAQAGDDLRILLERGEERRLTYKLEPTPNLSAPVTVGQKVGVYLALLDGKEVGRVHAVATKEVEKANWIIRFFRWLFAKLGIK
jgi:D-alanyl-D-alanine carboxypeptidase (penicillin-binding protein 5/6)